MLDYGGRRSAGACPLRGVLDQTAAASGHRAVAAVPETRSMHDCRLATWINGVTDNRTDTAIRVAQTGQRLTNKWCREPADDVRAHATNGPATTPVIPS